MAAHLALLNHLPITQTPGAQIASGRFAGLRGPDWRTGSRTPGLLPPSLAFLPVHGVPPGVLLAAISRAEAEAARPEEALLAVGLVTEEAYYRALARHLGLPFMEVSDDVALGSGTCFPRSVLAGVAPLANANRDGRAWLLAPSGRRLDQLLTLHRRGDLPRERFAIATPSGLRSIVLRHAPVEIANVISHELPDWRADLSARQETSLVQRLVFVACAMLLVAALLIGGGFWFAMSMLAGTVLAGATVLRLLAAAGSCDGGVDARAPPLADPDLPVFTVVVAMYREARVVPALVAALDALDYPLAKLDIKLVVEADDRETRCALERLALPARYEVLVVPDGVPRTKPRALNAALPLARGDHICVFDAEDVPNPQQLREAAAAFAIAPAAVACLQARLAIDNVEDSWLTRLFAMEYATLFDVVNPGLAWLGAPIPLGGTSNHFRTEVLRRLHGWDAWNVTEDIDLGLRLARFGYRVEALASSTLEEAPVTLGMWMRQRRRWWKGWMQTLLVHGRHPLGLWRDMGACNAVSTILLVGGALLGSLLGPLFMVVTTIDMLWGDLLHPVSTAGLIAAKCWCFIFLAGLGAGIWPMLLGMKRRGLLGYAGWIATMPAYWLLQTVAAWWALLDLFQDPFHWHKTEHGLTKARQKQHLR